MDFLHGGSLHKTFQNAGHVGLHGMLFRNTGFWVARSQLVCPSPRVLAEWILAGGGRDDGVAIAINSRRHRTMLFWSCPAVTPAFMRRTAEHCTASDPQGVKEQHSPHQQSG